MTERTLSNDDARVEPGDESKQKQTDADIIAHVLDSIKSRVMVGESVSATDYPEADRPAYWAAIALLRDELEHLKPAWRTIEERHIDGRRLREKVYRLRGSIDTVLAGWMCVAAVALILAVRRLLA